MIRVCVCANDGRDDDDVDGGNTLARQGERHSRMKIEKNVFFFFKHATRIGFIHAMANILYVYSETVDVSSIAPTDRSYAYK